MIHKFIKKIKNFIGNLSVKHKLLLAFYIQIIIPVIFIQYMYFQKTSNIVENKSINYSQDLLKMIEFRVNTFVDAIVLQSENILNDERVYKILNSPSNDIISIDDISMAGNIRSLLRKTSVSDNKIQSLCISSKDKRFYEYDKNGTRMSIIESMPYDEIMKASKSIKGKPIWYIEEKDGEVTNLFMSRMINDINSYDEIGMLTIAVNLNTFDSIIKDMKFSFLSNVFILSDKGQIISTINSDKKMVELIHKSKFEKNNGYYIDKRSKMLVSYVTVKNTGWKIVNYIPLKELYSEIDNMRNWFIFILIITLLISAYFSFITYVNIINPINDLAGAMKEFQSTGKFSNKRIVERQDEFGYLGRTFSSMLDKIDYLIECNYIEKITRRDAEIKALQAQINPHFLYNTLEYINWSAQLNSVPEISDMVSALSSIVEANVGRNGKFILLKDEVKYIDDYLFIVKKRYEDKLEFVKNIEPEVVDIRIPRLLIQPIVENAINYGVEGSRGRVTISLNAYKNEENIIIEVIDDGIGIGEEKLKKLNKSFTHESDYTIESEKRKGIGLKNVNRRIKLFYGEKYGLSIESEYMKYTKVRMNLPYGFEIEGGDLNV